MDPKHSVIKGLPYIAIIILLNTALYSYYYTIEDCPV